MPPVTLGVMPGRSGGFIRPQVGTRASGPMAQVSSRTRLDLSGLRVREDAWRSRMPGCPLVGG